MDTLWFDGTSPKTSNFSPVFSWLLTAVYFISPLKLSAEHLLQEGFPDFYSEVEIVLL